MERRSLEIYLSWYFVVFLRSSKVIWGIAKNLYSLLSEIVRLFCCFFFFFKTGDYFMATSFWSRMGGVHLSHVFSCFEHLCFLFLLTWSEDEELLLSLITKWVAFVFLRWQLLGRIELNIWKLISFLCGWKFYQLLLLKNSVLSLHCLILDDFWG